jgi:hypothetical protein
MVVSPKKKQTSNPAIDETDLVEEDSGTEPL